jgi:DNA polymerase III epsilon subunit-like protein
MTVKTILVFDTECTSLLPKIKNITKFNVKEFPHIVQISWVVYDLELKKVIKTKDFIVKVDVHISNSQIHGITDDISQEKGVDISFVLGQFVEDFVEVDQIICHNYNFDSLVIEAELFRLERKKEIKWMYNKDYYCTMLQTINFCKLEGKFYGTYKWPKLCELYELMFGYQFENQHNSLADVNATLRCYLKFVHDIN